MLQQNFVIVLLHLKNILQYQMQLQYTIYLMLFLDLLVTISLRSMLDVAPVKISPKGVFKYILIHTQTNAIVNRVVRGDEKHQYHADNFQAFCQELKQKNYVINKFNKGAGTMTVTKNNILTKIKCEGGGRIEHNYNGHKCFIYGYSKSYGHVDHKIAQQLIAKTLAYDIDSIQTNQGGY